MNNDIVQWRSHPRYFKEIDRKISNCNSYCCHTNNRKNNSNNNKNKDSYVNNLDNKQWNVVSSEATTECASSIDVAVATKLNCDKKNFNSSIATFNNDSDSDKNSSCSSCETFERCRRQQNADATTITNATTTNINDTFHSIPLIKGDDDDDAPSKFRVKRIVMAEATNQRRQSRTFYISKNNKNKNSRSRSSISSTSTTLSSHYLYRILFLWLQLFAALLTFTHNFGFVLASPSNAIDDCSSCTEDNSGGGHYTHTWAVHIPNGEEDGLADRVARDHGFINRGKIFNDHYHFEHHKISKRSLTPSDEHQSRLIEDSRVYWSKQQRAKSRQKRDFIRLRPSRTSSRALSLVDAVPLNDPKWPQMWYLNRGGGLDMNVIPAWKEGITGKGIVVTILDDGLESDHPDIEHNYDPLASYDVNSHDDDPMPHYDMTDSNRHGTRCAGEVAATANNSICAVGIAFGASVGGVRMLDGDVTDAVEARSLSLNPQHIDIYSASWGPDDDGKTVDGPGEMASRAFIEGVTKGRSGKGSIFIWASGNGGRELDNCNCDGYTNSIWTLSISSATEDGHVPWYSEKCSSTLATTYSSGGQGEKQVVTTDLHHSCTVSHTGTSASAPLAAGIAALVLESNNNLTWRDLQHIVVRTAKPANLKDPTWSKNGVGRRISHSFGYGLMDAAAMVRVARTWKTVPEQQRCEINAPHVDKTIPPEGYITLQLAVKHCMSVNYLEHVQAKITLTSQRRGDIQLYLKSPAGTRVTLLTSRLHDNSRSGFNQWPFMSVHTWGESPHGNWQLEIHNQGRYKGHALLREWSLIFYGTTQPIDPSDPVSIRRTNVAEITTPNSPSSSSTTTLHQVYSPLYPRLPPGNMATGNVIMKYPAKLPPNKSTYVSSSGTSVIGPSATSGSNKKVQQQQQQQGYQQISATYGVILGSQAKNSKSGNAGGGNNKNKEKNKEGKKGSNKASGNKSNNGAGNKKNQASAAIASSNTQKMKLYRILQELQGNMNANNNTNYNNNNNNNYKGKSKSVPNSLTARPAKLQLSMPTRQHSSEEKSSRKVIGDLPSSSKQQQTATTATTKIASFTKLPIKSTKQVKEKPQPPQPVPPAAASSLPPGKSSNVQSVTGNIADQRIPKMFERYNKIQAIFPEFEPYQAAIVKDQEVAAIQSNATTTSSRQAEKKHNEALIAAPRSSILASADILGTSSAASASAASKPSRENSKKSSKDFVLDPDILSKQQQLLIKAAAAAAASSKSALREELSAEQDSAQITQWDLIFYGTEVPAQPDDAIHIGSGKYDSFSGEMEHNDIEFDASGQWRNMQQVGESVVKSHDRTDAACTKTTIDQRCLDCAPPTFLYDGRCFDECPRHTYVVINEPSFLNNPGDIKTYSTDSDQEQLLSTDKRRRRRRVRCRRSRGNHRLSNTITTIEMAKNFSPQRQCHMCDSSCYQCYGPSNSQCSTCYPGSQLHRQPDTNETYCNAFAERSTNRFGDVIFNSRKQSFSSGQYVLSLVGIVAFIICTIVVSLYRRIIFSCNGNSNMFDKVQYSYDRVALLEEAEQDGDNIEEEENKSKSLQNVMNQNSKNANNDDSEEEIDLFSAE